jgi:hypothetical protein
MDDEKKWEQIRRALRAGAAGEDVAPVTSTLTLFGIKSHAEEVIEAAVAADEAVRAARRRARNAPDAATGAPGPEAKTVAATDDDGLDSPTAPAFGSPADACPSKPAHPQEP